MADTMITVGGRDFTVACREGEERYLQGAAALLDGEARFLAEHSGGQERMAESQMLLMAGLMLADKMANLQEKLRLAEEKLAAREEQLREIEKTGAEGDAMPDGLAERLRELTEKAEAIAGP